MDCTDVTCSAPSGDMDHPAEEITVPPKPLPVPRGLNNMKRRTKAWSAHSWDQACASSDFRSFSAPSTTRESDTSMTDCTWLSDWHPHVTCDLRRRGAADQVNVIRAGSGKWYRCLANVRWQPAMIYRRQSCVQEN